MFANKSVLITGAAKGIGRATAQAFWTAGAKVALLDRDEAALRDAARDFNGDGREVFTSVTDVAKSGDVNRAVTDSVNKFGGLDVLVANAGISFARAIDEYTDEEWHR